MPEPGTAATVEQTAKSIQATVAAIQAVASLIEDAARSVIVEVNNISSRTLRLQTVTLEHGIVVNPLPPDEISPFSTTVFAARSSGGAIATGTEGAVAYFIPDPSGGESTILTLKWVNPFIGGNEFSCAITGGMVGWYETRSVTGGGNKAAHMRAIFAEHADFGPPQADWLPCGECKALFYALDESSKCPSHSYDTGIEDQEGHHLFTYGKHAIAGSAFRLHQSTPGPNREPGWRKCTNCKALFWNGFPDYRKGVCVGRPPALGEEAGPGHHHGPGHVAEGSDFHLAFDMPLRGAQQKDWRWCDKCYELFYFPQNADAECAAGGQHHAHPYNYVLDYA